VIVAAASVTLTVVLLDATSVAVLLPTIRLELGSSSTGAAWVMAAYLLALAALLPVVAALGRGRAFAVAGGLLMAVGAVACATADSTSMLVTGRALQGAGAAAVLGSLAGGAPRPGRMALALPAMALALGPLVGGAFAELNWWHLYFWTGVPLAALAAVPAIVAHGQTRVAVGPDLPRRLALAAALTAITISLIQGEAWSWGWTALLLLAGAVLVSVARVGAPGRPAAVAAIACGGLAALAFLMPEYFELVRRLSGMRSGILLLALTAPAVTAWAIAREAGERLPELPVLAAAGLCAAAGLGLLVALDPDTAYAVTLGALVLVGAGVGTAAGAARNAQGPAHVLAWSAAGATLGLAAAVGAFEQAQADERSGGASFDQALSNGIGWAAVLLIVLLAGTALLISRAKPASSAAPPAGASSQPPRRPA
jgi:MFS family permease